MRLCLLAALQDMYTHMGAAPRGFVCGYSDPDSFWLRWNSKVQSVKAGGWENHYGIVGVCQVLSVDSCSRYVVMYIYDNPNVLKAYLASAEPDKLLAPRHS